MECTQDIQFWLDILVKLTPAFVSLVVGIFGLYIAFSQYITNRDKLRLDLFEKRIEAYEKLQEYFACVIQDDCIDNRALSILAEARYKSLFLFGSEITDYIDEAWEKALSIRRLNRKLEGPNSLPVGEERSKICDEERALLDWTQDQQNDSPKRYFKYLKFR